MVPEAPGLLESAQSSWEWGPFIGLGQAWVMCSVWGLVGWNIVYGNTSRNTGGFPGSSVIKNPPPKQETQVQSLVWEDPLEKEMRTHSSILAWEIPWTEEPGRLQSTVLQRVRCNLAPKQTTTNQKQRIGEKQLSVFTRR